jgi:hypothetical protein
MYSIIMLACTLFPVVVDDVKPVIIKPGDTVRMDKAGVLAATTYPNWQRLRDLMADQDAPGVKRMTESGTVVIVPGGSLGKVLKTPTGCLQVRITGGKLDGRVYFISRALATVNK